VSARGDELLELLLERGREAAARRAGDDAAARAELEQLARFVELCRRELSEPSDARLVSAILARTTRQDPSWRGDAALVGRFVRDALAASAWARAAAALLLVPLLGAPLLAWMVWREVRPTGFQTRIEIEQVEPFLPSAPDSPPGAIELPWDEDALGEVVGNRPALVVALPGEARSSAARQDSARALAAAGLPRPATGGALGEALARRAELWSAGIDRGPDVPAQRADAALAGALEVERLLDLWVREGRAPSGLDAALDRLGRDAAVALDVRRVEALALDRARAYGRVDAAAWARLAQSGARPGERSGADPVDRHWRANLAAALAHSPAGRELLADRDVAAWLQRR
jgi:hypothetical protein